VIKEEVSALFIALLILLHFPLPRAVFTQQSCSALETHMGCPCPISSGWGEEERPPQIQQCSSPHSPVPGPE